jgi:hypothetical protein
LKGIPTPSILHPPTTIINGMKMVRCCWPSFLASCCFVRPFLKNERLLLLLPDTNILSFNFQFWNIMESHAASCDTLLTNSRSVICKTWASFESCGAEKEVSARFRCFSFSFARPIRGRPPFAAFAPASPFLCPLFATRLPPRLSSSSSTHLVFSMEGRTAGKTG